MGLSFNQREERRSAHFPLIGIEPEQFQGTVRNINTRGLFIETTQIFPLSTHLTFNMLMGPSEQSMICAGEVVHIHDGRYSQRKGIGVKFANVDYPVLHRIKSYVETLAEASHAQAIQYNYKLLIGGEDIDTGVYNYAPNVNKMLTDYIGTMTALQQVKAGEPIEQYRDYIHGQYCIASSEHNHMAIKAAQEASQIFKFFPLSTRRAIMDTVRRLLYAYKDQMIEMMVAEGHARQLAEWEYWGMCEGYASDTLDFYQHSIEKRIGETDKGEVLIIRRPDGVVGVSPPTNAPCSNSATAGFALLAGNALIIKPPILAPLSTLFLWKEIFSCAAQEHGAPAGIINLIVGDSKVIMEEWVQSPHVNDIYFFGPSEIGLEVGKKAYQHGKKPILELSGNDMLMVWEDADLEESIQALSDGFLGSTQICMVPKKALIHEAIYDRFVPKFVEATRQLKPGLPNSKGVYLSPVVKIKQFYEFLEDAIQKGAKVLCGGKQINYLGEEDKNGCFIEPTVLAIEDHQQALTMRCVLEENFFPMLPLIKISETGNGNTGIFDTMIKMLEDNVFGLRASVWTQSPEYIDKFVNCAHNSGLLIINSRHVGFTKFLSTHGGVKKSGGPFGEMNYVWEKTSHAHGILIGKSAKR